MATATEYVHSFVSSMSSLFGAEPAPEPLPWYLEWWVFFGFYVSRIIWQVPLVPKVQPPAHGRRWLRPNDSPPTTGNATGNATAAR
jgi:hypothetical protein